MSGVLRLGGRRRGDRKESTFGKKWWRMSTLVRSPFDLRGLSWLPTLGSGIRCCPQVAADTARAGPGCDIDASLLAEQTGLFRQARALLAVPRVVPRHRIRYWTSHADRPR